MRITPLYIFPARLIPSPVLMVVALCHTSALGEITHRSGDPRDPSTLDLPPVPSSPRSCALVVTPGLVVTEGALAAMDPWSPRCGD